MNKLTKIFALIKEGNLDDLKNVITVDNVEAVDKDGKTALMIAVGRGYIEIVKYLVEEAKANVDVVSNSGRTALMYAAERGNIETVKYFTLQFKQISWLKMLLHT